MTDKVISLTDRLSEALGAREWSDGDDARHEQFLLDEGLALLAAYRAIQDRDVRMSLMALVQNLAKAQTGA